MAGSENFTALISTKPAFYVIWDKCAGVFSEGWSSLGGYWGKGPGSRHTDTGKRKSSPRELLDDYGEVKGDFVWLPVGIRGRVKFTTWTPHVNLRDCSWVEFEVT